MNSINLAKKNALGRVFYTLPKAQREEIFANAANIRGNYKRDNIRQYLYVNTKSNPARLDSALQAYMIGICSKFEYCFLPNTEVNKALERLAEVA